MPDYIPVLMIVLIVIEIGLLERLRGIYARNDRV